MNTFEIYLRSFLVLIKMDKSIKNVFRSLIRYKRNGLSGLELALIPIYEKYFLKDIEFFSGKPLHGDKVEEFIIWVCWWQGEAEMPAVIKNCYSRLRKLNPTKKVNLITKDNYKDYVDVPIKVLNAMKKGKISITHFADYLRTALIAKYGGIWVDATIFFNQQIIVPTDNAVFISQNLTENKDFVYDNQISEGRWSTYYWGTEYKKCIIFEYINSCLEKLITTYECIPYYFSMDLILRSAYDSNLAWKTEIDKVEHFAKDCHVFGSIWNEKLNFSFLDQIIKDNRFLKLSYKWPYESDKKDSYHDFFTSSEAVDYKLL